MNPKNRVERRMEVGPGDAGRLDVLIVRLTGLSRSNVRGLLDQGCVRVNGERCGEGAHAVAVGDRVALDYQSGRRYRERPGPWRSTGFGLIFEDAHLLVVDKRAGTLTVPNHDEPDTLVGLLSTYLSRGHKHRRRVFVVHRLDRDTSGVLVFGKNPKVAEQLKTQFEARKPEREYVAIVSGHLSQGEGTFRGYLATDTALNQYTTQDPLAGKLAVTHFRVTHRLAGATGVRVHLETGRRNQIRVHFAEAGHPVLGDTRYRPDLARHAHWKTRRLALHARMLGFTHPVSGQPLRFESPLPPEFMRLLDPAREVSTP